MLIHFEKNLTRDSRQFTIFKKYISPNLLALGDFRRKIKSDIRERTDRQTDEFIWGGLGNLRFLQVYHTCIARLEIHHTMSKIIFKISHRSHFDFRNITLTSGVLVLTLLAIEYYSTI